MGSKITQIRESLSSICLQSTELFFMEREERGEREREKKLSDVSSFNDTILSDQDRTLTNSS